MLTRRHFLQGTATAAGLLVLTSTFKAGAYAANEKLNVACIGVGGRGGAHLEPAATENLVALCDVDSRHLGGAAGKKYGPEKKPFTGKTFNDYRKMFDEMAKEIDTVFVATPDHTHFPAAMRAIGLGKNVYCEKPLTHSIWEARTLAAAARKAKVATQMGNQGMSSEGTRLLVEYVKAGAIGKVNEVHVWTDRAAPNWWAQNVSRPTYTDPVPAHIDWDLWLGVAPVRPYAEKWRDGPFQGKQVYHPFVWRGWLDFGTGALGDIACHAIGPIKWALDLGLPTVVEAKFEGGNNETYPAWSIITYEFPARGDLPPVKLVWYDGKKKPPKPAEMNPSRELPDNGSIFIGDKGKLMFEGGPRLLPEEKMKDFKKPEPTLPRIPAGDHHLDYFTACKGGRPACSNFDIAGPLAEAVLVGNLTLKFKNRIEWDGPNMKAKNCPEADSVIHREYRKGFVL
jgi:predicted dehydrogenase